MSLWSVVVFIGLCVFFYKKCVFFYKKHTFYRFVKPNVKCYDKNLSFWYIYFFGGRVSLMDGISSKVWKAGGDPTIHSSVAEIPGVVSHGLRGQL